MSLFRHNKLDVRISYCMTKPGRLYLVLITFGFAEIRSHDLFWKDVLSGIVLRPLERYT